MGKRAQSFGAADLAPPVALAVLGAADLALSGGGDFPGRPVVNAALLLGVSLPLLWRRRAPIAVLSAIVIVTSGWIFALYYQHDRQPPIEAGLALIVAMYSTAAYASRRRLPAAAALSVAVVLADVLRLVAGAAVSETVPAWLFYLLAWVVGLGLRRRIESESGLRARAARLHRERDERARAAALAERDRIARELHDVIAHRISMIVMQSSIERRMLGDGSGRAGEVLASIEQSGREAMIELRRLLGVLRGPDDAPDLRPQPTLGDLDELVGRARGAGLDVELRFEGAPRELPAGVELSAFRIAQEALTNVAKHAAASHAKVLVRYRGDAIEVAVLDDGRGGPAHSDGGFGLVGMRERAALHGGSLDAGPREAGGFAIHAILPLGELAR